RLGRHGPDQRRTRSTTRHLPAAEDGQGVQLVVLRVLAITKIFPNAAEPLAAPFNRQQFAALREHCELNILATIPWFPGAGLLSKWSTAGKLARVPRRERIHGMDVSHPRTLFVPKLAMVTWGPLYAASI